MEEIIKKNLTLLFQILKHAPKKSLTIFVLTSAGCCALFMYKPNLIHSMINAFKNEKNEKLSFYEIQSIAEYYRRYTENEVNNVVQELAQIIKCGTWVVQGMQNQKIYSPPQSVENWGFESRIIYLKEYDYEKKLVFDARHKRKDRSELVIGHNTKTMELNKPRFWSNSSDIEYTENYIEDGGENVETMFGQFWFNTYIKGGASGCESVDSLYSVRNVIMLDKEAFECMEVVKTQKEKILTKHAEKLRDNQMRAIILPKN